MTRIISSPCSYEKEQGDFFIVLSAEFLRNRLVLENMGLFMVEKDYFV